MAMIWTNGVRAFVGAFHRKLYVDDTGKSISGIVTRGGAVFPRARVWLIDRRTAQLVAATSSDENGHYIFRSVTPIGDGITDGYVVLGFDDTQTYDPEAKDFIKPEEDA